MRAALRDLKVFEINSIVGGTSDCRCESRLGLVIEQPLIRDLNACMQTCCNMAVAYFWSGDKYACWTSTFIGVISD